MFGNIVKPFVSATLVLATLFLGIPNGSSNIFFGNVVKPFVLATLCLKLL